MTKEEQALVERVRAKHHPYFAQLEALVGGKFPHLDEFSVAVTVCQLIETVDLLDEMAVRDTNPGLDLVQ